MCFPLFFIQIWRISVKKAEISQNLVPMFLVEIYRTRLILLKYNATVFFILIKLLFYEEIFRFVLK